MKKLYRALILCWACSSLGLAQDPASENRSVSLDDYLASHNQKVTEGYICNRTHLQADFFTTLLQRNLQIKTIAEIGFNAGHSSDLFLKTRPDLQVVSFDIMEHGYARIGKEFIGKYYPGRHILVEGNSLTTVPDFHKAHETQTFDLIFIDGGHDFKTALNDIINMKALASPTTLLVVDDIKYKPVMKAWEQCEKQGLVKEIQRFSGGGKAWMLGSYCW